MDTKRLKRVLSVILCIICLIPSVTSFAAEICPECGGRIYPRQTKTKYVKKDDTYHKVIETRQYTCSGRCRTSFERIISTTEKKHIMGEWIRLCPDGYYVTERRAKSSCVMCGCIAYKPYNLGIYEVFGSDLLKATTYNSDYVYNMKSALKNWALYNGHTFLADRIMNFDGNSKAFASTTEAVVKDFQKACGIDEDGLVGDDTKIKLLPYFTSLP